MVVDGLVDLRPENVGKEMEGMFEEEEEEEEPWRGTERARIAWERVREEDEAMAPTLVQKFLGERRLRGVFVWVDRLMII